jgi:hypothetical protein
MRNRHFTSYFIYVQSNRRRCAFKHGRWILFLPFDMITVAGIVCGNGCMRTALLHSVTDLRPEGRLH